MPLDRVLSILNSYKRLLDYLNSHGYDEVVECVQVCEDEYLQITLRNHIGSTYDVITWDDAVTGELYVESAETRQSFFDVYKEFGITEPGLSYIRFGKR